MRRRPVLAVLAAVALTLPWVGSWFVTSAVPLLAATAGVAYEAPATSWLQSPTSTVLVSGLAVLGASFLLAWGAETAEKDVPTAFAIAVLAVLAVAPEYAVDALYAWNAGQFAGTERGVEAGHLAVANMTGANRILIGVGWAGIALFTVYRAGSSADPAVERRRGLLASVVSLDRDIGLEITFLLAATLWAFFVPLNGGIDALDMLVLVGLYLAYIAVVLRGDVEDHDEQVGIPAYLQSFRKRRRVATVLLLFGYSGLAIFTAVEPFAHGLEAVGKAAGVPPFFMVQWVAPLASEAPELIVVAYLVNKARSTAGFNALISSKLNQWTLLIGTLVVVYSIALGSYGPLTFDHRQSAEIWLTAAQSLFALSLLVDFQISVREALGLLVLFVAQVAVEFLIVRETFALPFTSVDLLHGFSVLYVGLAVALFVSRRDDVLSLVGRSRTTVVRALSTADEAPAVSDD